MDRLHIRGDKNMGKSKSVAYRKNGNIKTGFAWLVVVGGFIIYNYIDYIIPLVLILATIWLASRAFKKPNINNISLSQIDHMTGSEFEDYLVTLFKAKGYKTHRTKGSGDQGVDIILDERSGRTAIQAKRYSGSVGNKAVQEVVAGIRYYNADKAMVITNNNFTRSAIDLARVNNVELIDRNKLKKMIVS